MIHITTYTKYKKKSLSIILKIKLWKLFFGNCQCCKLPIEIINLDLGHIKSKSTNEETCLNNLRSICIPCNSSMGTENMDEFIKKCRFNKINTNTYSKLKTM